jgi:hypothetical protein
MRRIKFRIGNGGTKGYRGAMTHAKQREAACACGQLKIKVSGDPQMVSSCHCRACQRRTGAPFGVQAFFPLDRVVSIDGERKTWSRTADSGTTVNHHFCPSCGTTLYWDRANLPGMLTVAVGTFADPQFPMPARTVWTETKHDWLSFPAAMPHYPRAPS